MCWQLSSLTTYRGAATFSNNAITGTGDKTSWVYDPASGLLKSKKYADNTQESYTYNGRFQLVGVNKPGITGSSFAYGGRMVKIFGRVKRVPDRYRIIAIA